MFYKDKDGHTVDLVDDCALETVLLVDGSTEVRFKGDDTGRLDQDEFERLAELALHRVVGDR